MDTKIPVTVEFTFPEMCGLKSDCDSPTQIVTLNKKTSRRPRGDNIKRIRRDLLRKCKSRMGDLSINRMRHDLLRKCKKGKRRNYPKFHLKEPSLMIDFYESKQQNSIRKHLLAWYL